MRDRWMRDGKRDRQTIPTLQLRPTVYSNSAFISTVFTSVWTPETELCWEILDDKFECLPTHRCIAADPKWEKEQACQAIGWISFQWKNTWKKAQVLQLTLFSWLGMMHRTKCGVVFLSVPIKSFSCSCGEKKAVAVNSKPYAVSVVSVLCRAVRQYGTFLSWDVNRLWQRLACHARYLQE